ncbi:MAG TPA: hypothetical protein VKH35_06945 [Thermoanaerobaculia bacterium]|nr:hypothetical protein [Thermoanaerobaculia bacterium]
MRKRTTAFVLISALLSAIPAFAGSSSALMSVSVEVIARTLLNVDTQPESVDITRVDLARGYLDIPQAVTFRVRSNAARGYELQFEPVAFPFTTAAVTVGAGVATIRSDGAWLTEPYQHGTTGGTMSVRLWLAPGTQPGSYAWPVVFTANSR